MQRGEQHDSVAIKVFLYFRRQQQRRSPLGKAFAVLRPLQDLSHVLDIIFMFLRIAQSFLDFFVADEFLCLL